MPPSATFCHSVVDLAVGLAANSRKVDGLTPSVATESAVHLDPGGIQQVGRRHAGQLARSRRSRLAGSVCGAIDQQVSGLAACERPERQAACRSSKLTSRYCRRPAGLGRQEDARLLRGGPSVWPACARAAAASVTALAPAADEFVPTGGEHGAVTLVDRRLSARHRSGGARQRRCTNARRQASHDARRGRHPADQHAGGVLRRAPDNSPRRPSARLGGPVRPTMLSFGAYVHTPQIPMIVHQDFL